MFEIGGNSVKEERRENQLEFQKDSMKGLT
jgi:hypothetical protein